MAKTILTVDDSTSVRKMVESALRFKGYGVVTSADGLEALEALERGQFDLVVLDINMPGLDGLSVLRSIRDRPEWADLPVLMLTTEGREEDRDRALALGATGYMLKPFQPTELLKCVAALLE